MDKIKLTSEKDIFKAVEYFGEDNAQAIKAEIKSYPCFIIGSYSDDEELGKGYDFMSIGLNEF